MFSSLTKRHIWWQQNPKIQHCYSYDSKPVLFNFNFHYPVPPFRQLTFQVLIFCSLQCHLSHYSFIHHNTTTVNTGTNLNKMDTSNIDVCVHMNIKIITVRKNTCNLCPSFKYFNMCCIQHM